MIACVSVVLTLAGFLVWFLTTLPQGHSELVTL
jgi:hypothetical protein